MSDLAIELTAIRAYRAGVNTSNKHYVMQLCSYSIRSRLNLTQDAFAALMGVSKRTLEQWEQGRRKPHGSALALLKIADRHPEVFLDEH